MKEQTALLNDGINKTVKVLKEPQRELLSLIQDGYHVFIWDVCVPLSEEANSLIAK